MLGRNKVRTTLNRLRRGELDGKQMSKANRLLTTFAVLAEAERDFGRLNAELAASPCRGPSGGCRASRIVARRGPASKRDFRGPRGSREADVQRCV